MATGGRRGRKPGTPKTGGRQKGAANKVTRDVKAAARDYAPQALETLIELLGRKDNPASQLGAARELLDRGYGKPTQPVSGDDDMPPIRATLKVSFVGPTQDH